MRNQRSASNEIITLDPQICLFPLPFANRPPFLSSFVDNDPKKKKTFGDQRASRNAVMRYVRKAAKITDSRRVVKVLVAHDLAVVVQLVHCSPQLRCAQRQIPEWIIHKAQPTSGINDGHSSVSSAWTLHCDIRPAGPVIHASFSFTDESP